MKTSTAFLMVLIFCAAGRLPAQQTSKTSEYLLGKEESLEMVVAIWGEVKSPGEYRVPYNTNLVELISIAGGPTQNARLSKVRITGKAGAWKTNPKTLEAVIKDSPEPLDEEQLKRRLETVSRKIIEYNVDRYMSDPQMATPPPILQPGDVVLVETDSWYRSREIIRAIHEVALIATVYVWYLRAIK